MACVYGRPSYCTGFNFGYRIGDVLQRTGNDNADCRPIHRMLRFCYAVYLLLAV